MDAANLGAAAADMTLWGLFLQADIMIASIVVIGIIGFVFERLVFGSIERATVHRWGMVRAAKG